MTSPDIATVLSGLISGAYDDHLDGLVEAAGDRRKALASSKFYTVKIGDTGTLENVNPKYLNGAPFTVVSKRRSKIEIKLDQAWLDKNWQAKQRWSGSVVCPPEYLKFD
jgi:hypothetical protein